MAAVEDLIARDSVRAIGTDPGEWWGLDPSQVIQIYQTHLQEMGSIDFTPTHPEGFSEGNVGWTADQPKLRMPDGTELELRFTGVLRRDNGAWRFQQMHFSLGVANGEAFGRELTTQMP